MFQFPTFALHNYVFIMQWPFGRVPPFRYPRINAYSQLPTAFRSVSRLSSPLIAKASSKCPYLSLDSYNINISLRKISISLNKKSTRFSQKNFLVYISILFYLDFFFDNTIFLSYYSASSLFTMFYNYPKKMFLVEVRRIELLTPCLQSRCSPSWAIPPNWWVWEDLNFRPYAYQAYALTTWATNPAKGLPPSSSS